MAEESSGYLWQTAEKCNHVIGKNWTLVKEKYVEMIIKDPQLASKMEAFLKLLSYMIPGRFETSHVLSELAYSASNLLNFLHDCIYRQRLKKTLDSVEGSPVNIHLTTWLTIIEYLEVFIELGSSKFWGEKLRWIVIFAIQVIKWVLRLILLYKCRTGIQRYPLILPFNRDKIQQANEDDNTQEIDDPHLEHQPTAFTGQRSGRRIRTLAGSSAQVHRTWSVPEQLNEQELDYDCLQPTVLSGRGLLAETLHITRPLVHLTSMYKFGSSSWKPWLLSCSIDITSLIMHADTSELNPAERAEIARRNFLLLFYFLRSPFFDKYSKTKIIAVLKFISDTVPGAGFLMEPLLAYLPEWQKIYFYNWQI